MSRFSKNMVQRTVRFVRTHAAGVFVAMLVTATLAMTLWQFSTGDRAEHKQQPVALAPQAPVVSLLPVDENELRRFLQAEADRVQPPGRIEVIPPWLIGDPASQLIPNYEPEMARVVLVAPTAPATQQR